MHRNPSILEGKNYYSFSMPSSSACEQIDICRNLDTYLAIIVKFRVDDVGEKAAFDHHFFALFLFWPDASSDGSFDD